MIPGTTSSQGKYVDPPTSVTASAGNAQATVSFTLPVYDGKGVATYVATSSPSGITASGASSPITVTGLANGTSYTFTVTTISGYGVSAVSSASGAVSPAAPNPCAGSPAAGTVLSANYCSGTTLVRNVSDGCNGTTVQTVESNSATCGYNPCAGVNCNTLNQSPPPGNGWNPSGSVNLAWSISACTGAGYLGLSSECNPASGYSLWYVYYSANNCCVYNLFSGTCGCSPQLGEMA